MRYESGERYEILYDLPRGEYSDTGVGGIRTRTIRAGEALEVECFPIVRVDHEAKREKRMRASSPAQEKLNLANARKRVRRLLEANFVPGDIALHLTFAYPAADPGMVNLRQAREQWVKDGLPECEDDARRHIRNYISRVKRAIRRAGEDPKGLKYLYVIEGSREAGPDSANTLPPKFHFHAVIHAPGLSREALEELWPFGFANADRLSFQHDGLKPLADYITKQRRFSRRWAHSKNLKEPEVRVSDRKISRRRAALVAEDVRQYGRQIFEKVYPGYQCVEEPCVRYSDFVAGAYIFARLRLRHPSGVAATRGDTFGSRALVEPAALPQQRRARR